MIFESHAHYAHRRFASEFPYLGWQDGDFTIERGELSDLLKAMEQNGIVGWIEPGTSLENIPNQFDLADDYPQAKIAIGVHPKKCLETAWDDRKQLLAYLKDKRVVAIGETGLDYSMAQETQNRPLQQQWFAYQLQLAHEHELPLILHVRQADADALQILSSHRDKLHGGVAHCFGGDYVAAKAYLDLGFTLGIGGRLLHDDPLGLRLQDTVKKVSLSSILLETDAPYILPDLRQMPYSGKQRKRSRNSSLILPAVLHRIAQLRGESEELVEETIYQNTLSVFHLQPSQK